MRINGKNREYRNDRAGLIFLFSLLSLIFFADFAIEISKTGLFRNGHEADRQISSISLSYELSAASAAVSSPGLHSSVFGKEEQTEEPFVLKRLSLFFYLLASFAFFLEFLRNKESADKIDYFPDIGFISLPKSKYALPRPPPEQPAH